MNLIAYKLSETLVHELMSCQRPLTLEFARNDERFEVGIVRARNFDGCVVKAGLDQTAYFDWVHSDKRFVSFRGAQCTGKAQVFPMRSSDCV